MSWANAAGRLMPCVCSAILSFSSEIKRLYGAVRLKKASVFTTTAILAALLLAGCGGGDENTQQDTTSKLKNRAFVTNSFFGYVAIVDADLDRQTAFSIQVGTNATYMVPTPDKKHILTYSDGSSSVSLIQVDAEAPSAIIGLPNWSESIAITSDAKTGYAAVKNATVTGSAPGAIQVLDFANQKISSTIPIPSVRWLALNHAGTRLLAFSDQSDVVRLVDLTPTTPTVTVVTGTFSRPVAAYFTADDSKAYILSCGTECGATGAVPPDTKASVTELTIASGATRTVSVNAATVALLDGNTLYVAGAPGGSGGTLDTVDVNTMTRTSSVAIGPGSHRVIKSGGGKIWVGATGCGTAEGCLSVFTPGGDVIVDTPGTGQTSKGAVTGMSVVSGRNLMYVVEGGQLRSYDLGSAAEVTPFSLDIRGTLYDVVTVP